VGRRERGQGPVRHDGGAFILIFVHVCAIRLTLTCFVNLQEAATRAGQNPNFAQAPQQEQVTVERAVCQILMGRIEDAAYTLGLTQEQLAYGMADPQVER
jgi:hypothetical protein